MTWPLKYFQPQELLSPDTITAPWLLDMESAQKLDDFRAWINVRLICNFGNHRRRGVRSTREHYELMIHGAGATLSMHLTGKAFDIHSPDITVAELYRLAIQYDWPFVKLYPTWIHVDTGKRQ